MDLGPASEGCSILQCSSPALETSFNNPPFLWPPHGRKAQGSREEVEERHRFLCRPCSLRVHVCFPKDGFVLLGGRQPTCVVGFVHESLSQQHWWCQPCGGKSPRCWGEPTEPWAVLLQPLSQHRALPCVRPCEDKRCEKGPLHTCPRSEGFRCKACLRVGVVPWRRAEEGELNFGQRARGSVPSGRHLSRICGRGCIPISAGGQADVKGGVQVEGTARAKLGRQVFVSWGVPGFGWSRLSRPWWEVRQVDWCWVTGSEHHALAQLCLLGQCLRHPCR